MVISINNRSCELIKKYLMKPHPEGGYFFENYTSKFMCDNRPLAGNIYFLLDSNDISHFHQIDCDEIWYFHEGCGLKITLLFNNSKKELFLGDGKNQEHMIIIPVGAIFAAENIDKEVTLSYLA